jgi:hypothetical protein
MGMSIMPFLPFFSSNKFDETPPCSHMNLESYEPKTLDVHLQNSQNLVSSRIGQILTSKILVILPISK